MGLETDITNQHGQVSRREAAPRHFQELPSFFHGANLEAIFSCLLRFLSFPTVLYLFVALGLCLWPFTRRG